MKHRARAILFLAITLLGQALWAQNHCVVCHASLGEKHEALLKSFEGDIHRQKGLTCASCHGGNPGTDDMGEAMSPAAGFVGVPSRAEIPAFCGKCHSNPEFMKTFNPSLAVDQQTKYFTSVHGRRLKKGDAKVATCADCHPAHAIRPASDPVSSVNPRNVPATCGRCHSDAKRMASYSVPTDQQAKYATSVHGRALFEKGDTAAPVCNTCHGNHGAVPPGVENIAHVCGMCHANNEEYFKSSPMAKTWADKKIHFCTTCHLHHDIQHPTTEILSPEKGLCRQCHTTGSKALRTGIDIKEKVDQAENDYHEAELALREAEEKGMDMAEAKDSLDAGRMALFQTKTVVHTFRAEQVSEAAERSRSETTKAKAAARSAVQEFRWRRVGLGIAIVLMTFLMLALFLKIRDIEDGSPHP